MVCPPTRVAGGPQLPAMQGAMSNRFDLGRLSSNLRRTDLYVSPRSYCESVLNVCKTLHVQQKCLIMDSPPHPSCTEPSNFIGAYFKRSKSRETLGEGYKYRGGGKQQRNITGIVRFRTNSCIFMRQRNFCRKKCRVCVCVHQSDSVPASIRKVS